jgi:hypothetical protein
LNNFVLVNYLALKFGRHTNNLISGSWVKCQGKIEICDLSRGFQSGQTWIFPTAKPKTPNFLSPTVHETKHLKQCRRKQGPSHTVLTKHIKGSTWPWSPTTNFCCCFGPQSCAISKLWLFYTVWFRPMIPINGRG